MSKFVDQFNAYNFTAVEIAIRPTVMPCSSWNAKPPKISSQPIPKLIGLALHHMDNQNRPPEVRPIKALEVGAQICRDCQNLHMDTNNWNDTGQQLTNTVEGILWEGRHGSAFAFNNGTAFPVGAQCEDHNTETIGVEHEGTYIDLIPSRAQLLTTLRLCAWVCLTQDLDTSCIDGHRHWCSTQCPGDAFYELIPRIREMAHYGKVLLGTRWHKLEAGAWVSSS